MYNKVLIVDDDPIFCEIVQVFLRRAGIPDVLVASDGRAALEVLDREAEEIELIILDIHLPEIDGIQLLGKFRERAIRSPIALISSKMVMMSAAKKLARQYKLNVVTALIKPLTAAEMERWFIKPRDA